MRRAYAFTRPVLNTYLARDRDRRRRRELGWVLLAVLPVGICGLVYVWLHYQVLVTGYNLPILERNLDARLQVERSLSLEATFLAAPEKIEKRAVEELDMIVPEADQVVFAEQLQ
ncbi:MAG: cell division protein FtsL [Acidobacteriota bacterium]|nr:cell division protein FtsL [Acidobacteriota bacterium]